jgi:hypothetical protein
MSQEMNKNEKTFGKNENVENPLTTTTPQRAGDKPAEIIYREIRIVEPSAELVQDLKNREAGKPFTLGHDKMKDKPFEHDKPLTREHDKPLTKEHDKPLTKEHDRPLAKDKGFEHDKPLHDKHPEVIVGDKYGAGKPVHDLGHDDSVPKVKHGPADLTDKLHGERLKDKKYDDAPKHDKDAYIGGKPVAAGDHEIPYIGNKSMAPIESEEGRGKKLFGKHHDKHHDKHIKPDDRDKHIRPDEQRFVGGEKHLAYPAEEPYVKEDKHIGDKYHNDKGADLGQNLGQAYDDGATSKYTVEPAAHDKLLGPAAHDKHVSPVAHDKHLLGKKHDHDKHKLTDDNDKHIGDKYHSDKGADLGQNLGQDDGGKKHKGILGLGKKHHDKKVDEPLVGEKHHKKHDKHPKTHDKHLAEDVVPDKHTIKDGDVVAHGEKVKDKHQLREADHIGDKYITKSGWDFGQNLGKKYDDADSYKLTDGKHYVPDTVPEGERVAPVGEHARLGGEHARLGGERVKTPSPAPAFAAPAPASATPEKIVVPSAHGERVYGHGHELKDGDRLIGDRHLAREGDLIDDENRKDKHLKDKDYVAEGADESHKKPGVIGKVIEKVKEKFSSKDKDTTPDPATDKGHQWEKVHDKRSGSPHWKDDGVLKGHKQKSKETY